MLRVVFLASVFGSILLAGCTQRVLRPVPRRPVYQPAPPPPAPSVAIPVPVEQRIVLGHSVDGTPLELFIFGEGSPVIFIMGGIHGDEPSSSHVAQNLVQHLRAHREAYAGCTVGILPAANPDGLAAGRRTNARGVDLNRNFPARNWRAAGGERCTHGARPASEPETRAILQAMRRLRPECVVSIHAISGQRECNNFDGPAGELAELMARLNGYPVLPHMGYPTPGSLGSWAGIDQDIPVITLELPKRHGGPRSWQRNRAALLALIQAGDHAAPMAR